MKMSGNHVVRRIYNTHDENVSDLTASFYELEPFDSIVQALEWRQIKQRLPLCMKKTLRNRFTLPHFIYLWYASGLLTVDFHEYFNPPSNSTSDQSCGSTLNISAMRTCILDQPVQNLPIVNRVYIGKF